MVISLLNNILFKSQHIEGKRKLSRDHIVSFKQSAALLPTIPPMDVLFENFSLEQ